ncbi:MAG: hypothetical protein KDH89_22420, partial [Anaerolineae bacterium]|nr:hypothetical protein [Anaerolineae bacterium]
MAAEHAFYGFLLIGALGAYWSVDAVLYAHPTLKDRLCTTPVMVILLVGILISISLVALGIYHGHSIVVLYIFLLPTLMAIFLLKRAV